VVVCYRSVQNPLSLILIKDVKVKIYKIIILPVALYGCETWSFSLGEEDFMQSKHKSSGYTRILCKIFKGIWFAVFIVL
jgi:hypothetical protein